MKQKKIITWILIVALLALFIWKLITNSNTTLKTEQDSRLLMDTVITITVVAPADEVKGTLDKGFAEISRIDDLTNRYSLASGVSKLNQARTLEVNQDLINIIKISEEYRKKSSNAFDIRLGRLVDLWGFGDDRQNVPTKEEIDQAMPTGDISITNKKVTLPNDVLIDLGGVAKGYGIEQARNVMKKTSKAGLIVGGGSSVACWGEHPEERPWRVGLKHPRNPTKLIGVIELENGWSLGTSGDYERFFILDSRRYHHILDGRNGYPPEDVYATTIMIKDSTLADMLSTLLFALGPTEGKAFLDNNKLGDLGVIWVVAPGEIITYEKGVKLPELTY
ncbi:MAG: FAD:protein FMN transferase [Firmicutes bacterium]|nr:FAD:protein FMN transferase [Bacillota bacterium]